MRPRPIGLLAFALLLVGCATATPPPRVYVTGRWTGTWAGRGVLEIPRDERATLDLVQQGSGGEGRLVMEGALAADLVPMAVRDATMVGIRVILTVSGDKVHLEHELGAPLFEADLVVRGDRMLGQARQARDYTETLYAWPYVYLVLTREPAMPVSVSVAAARPSAPPPPQPEAGPSPPPPPPSAPVFVPAEPPRVAEPAPGVSPFEPQRRIASPPSEFVAIREVRPIHFDFDSFAIRPDDAKILDANAEWLRAHPDQLVLLVGHCDERGTPEYNVALGERRARATMLYLVERGISTSRMTITSYGIENPECKDRTEACWARNRRVITLVKPR